MLHMIQELLSHCSMFWIELSQSVTVSMLYHLQLIQLTCFTLSSDGSIFPASDIVSSAFPYIVNIWNVKATGFGSGLSKSVYLSINALAYSNIVPFAPVTVFHHESIASWAHPSYGIYSSPAELEDLMLDIVPLWVANREEYSKLNERKISGL